MLREISIHKYRGFRDVSFKIGTNLTVIAGQNGTNHTNMLTQEEINRMSDQEVTVWWTLKKC